MSKQTEFLKKEKILHLATIDEKNSPHIVPVWYMYSAGKIYVGTNWRLSVSEDGGGSFTNYSTSNGLGHNQINDIYVR